MLPFGPELMLERVVRLIGQVVDMDQIVVVAAQCQPLPNLSDRVLVVHDARPERGPLEGLAAGLRALADRVDAVYVTGCDVPRIVPAFVECMFALLETHSIAVPRDGEFFHPLAAVYRTSVLPHVHQLLAADRLRLSFLAQELDTREVDTNILRAVDPSLVTLQNLNTHEDYAAALLACGFELP